MTDESEERRETRMVLMEAPQSSSDNEINLIELFRLMLGSWKLIGGVTVLVTIAAVVYALLSPEIYKAETLLAPAKEDKPRFSSAFSQFGGLASLAGVSIPSDTDKEQVIATLKSRKFLTRFLGEQNLLPILFAEKWDEAKGEWKIEPDGEIPTAEDAYLAFSGVMEVTENKKTGLITLSIYWKDPEVAAQWANDLIIRLNKQLQEKAIEDSRKRIGYLREELAKRKVKDMVDMLFSLIESETHKEMLANVNEEFALEVIDPAVAPEQRIRPKRKLIVIIGGVCGIFLGISTVFLREFLRKLRNPIAKQAAT